MKKLFLLIAVISVVTLTNCNKNDEDFSLNQQPVKELKHSATPIPFNGRVSGYCNTLSEGCEPGWNRRYVEAQGNVTHMGKVDATMDYCMKLEYPSIDPGYDGIYNGGAKLVAANGDELNAYVVGNIEFVFSETNQILGGNIIGWAAIFGGTGRFEGAHGYIEGSGYMDFTGPGGVLGSNIPISYDFWGFINYGSEYFDVTLTGAQSTRGACEGGGNGYSQTGTGTGTLGNINTSMDYCTHTEFLPTPIPFSFPLPPGTPIGGTNEGTALLTDAETSDDWMSSSYNSTYRFTFLPGPPLTILNDTYAVGMITGGGGEYEGATGKFVMFGTQSFVYPNPDGATGSVRCIGYVTY